MSKRFLIKASKALLGLAVLSEVCMIVGWITGIPGFSQFWGSVCFFSIIGFCGIELYIDKKYKKEA